MILLLAMTLPALGLMVGASFDERGRARQQREESVTILSTLLAAHIEAIFISAHQILLALASNHEVIGGGIECQTYLDTLDTSKHFSGFSFRTPDGVVVCSNPRAMKPTSLDPVSRARIAAGSDFVVGPQMIGPLSGRPVVLASQAVRRETGLAGVVTAGLDLAKLSALGERIDLPLTGALTVLDGDGFVVTRYPDPERWIGRRVQESELFRAVSTRPTRGAVEAIGLDGVERIYGHFTLETGGSTLLVMVGLNRDEALDAADSILRRNLIVFGGAAGLLLVMVIGAANSWIKKPITEQLRQQNDRLTALSARLLNVHEVERRALARELHDDIGQALTALKLTLQSVRRDNDATAPYLSEAIAVAGRTLEQVRTMSLGLRPPMLDHLGLEATLRWYVQQQSNLGSFSIQLHVELFEDRLSPALEITVFRIVQEALTNIARHAHAREVTIHLVRRRDVIDLTIADDGTGFDVAQAQNDIQSGHSTGLLGMEERAALIGGRLTIDSGTGGTVIRAVLPQRTPPSSA